MNDLLGDIKPTIAAGGYARGPGNSNGGDVEMGSSGGAAGDQDALQSYFREVESIKKEMDGIKAAQRDLMTMHENTKAMIKTREVQQARQAMEVRD